MFLADKFEQLCFKMITPKKKYGGSVGNFLRNRTQSLALIKNAANMYFTKMLEAPGYFLIKSGFSFIKHKNCHLQI
jgi:hypothetical protein